MKPLFQRFFFLFSENIENPCPSVHPWVVNPEKLCPTSSSVLSRKLHLKNERSFFIPLQLPDPPFSSRLVKKKISVCARNPFFYPHFFSLEFPLRIFFVTIIAAHGRESMIFVPWPPKATS